MKKKILARGWIILLVVNGSVQNSVAQISKGVAGSLPADADGMGRYICAHIDMDKPDMHKVKQLANTGNFIAALNAWRDTKVIAFRNSPIGNFAFHTSWLSGARLQTADALTGKIRPEDVKMNVNTNFEDVFNISGAPGAQNKFNWLTTDAHGNYYSTYSNLYLTIPLTVRYWQTGDDIYLNKWFEIVADFAGRQRDAVAALPVEQQRKVPVNWRPNDAASSLSQGDRVLTILSGLAVLSKNLPGGGHTADWGETTNAQLSPISSSSLNKIPSLGLARIAVSLVSDHTPALIERYVPVGAVPNQRRNGLAALLEISLLFQEFKEAGQIRDQATTGLNNYLAGAFQPDGGMLEQSLNYNINDAGSLGQLADLIKTTLPDLSKNLKNKQISFYRMAAAINTPLREVPGLGSRVSVNPGPVWLSTNTRETWFNKQILERPGKEDPMVADIYNKICGNETNPSIQFTSVAFPYSGYYVQRRDWNWDSPYLFFVSSRLSRGHRSRADNSLQICAFGRPLLTYGGPMIYSPEQLTPELRADYEPANIYFGENSSLKSNTVVVDGKSQIETQNFPPAQQAFDTTLPFKWYTSADFDYLEGNYQLGYVMPKDAEHRRQIIFVHDPGFWILVDEVNINDRKSHVISQIWRFPPKAKTSYGFGKEDIRVDNQNNCLFTAQQGAPNIRLYQFCSMPLNCQVYYGDKNPYMGWTAVGFGRLTPSPDAHVSWNSAGKSVVITLIWPQANDATPDIQTRNLSTTEDNGHAGVEIKLPDGRKITCIAATECQALHSGPVSYQAKLMFTTNYKNGTTKGLIMDGKITGEENFSFVWRDNKFTNIAKVQAPQGFSWIQNDKGLYPSYDK